MAQCTTPRTVGIYGCAGNRRVFGLNHCRTGPSEPMLSVLEEPNVMGSERLLARHCERVFTANGIVGTMGSRISKTSMNGTRVHLTPEFGVSTPHPWIAWAGHAKGRESDFLWAEPPCSLSQPWPFPCAFLGSYVQCDGTPPSCQVTRRPSHHPPNRACRHVGLPFPGFRLLAPSRAEVRTAPPAKISKGQRLESRLVAWEAG